MTHVGRHSQALLCVGLVLGVLSILENASLAQEVHGSLRGSVRDQTTGAPIPNVNVWILGTGFGAATDSKGSFSLYGLPPGDYVLVVRHVAYHQASRIVTVHPGAATTVDVSLLDRVILMEEIEIVEESPQFGLSHAAQGRVVTREEISRYPNATFSELLQAVIPAARVREDDGNLKIELIRASSIFQRYGRLTDANPLIILNGTKIGTVTSHLDRMLRSQEIERMEVISGPSALIYGWEARNGVIIIDTVSPVTEARSDVSLYFFLGAAAGFLLLYLVSP